LSEDKSSFNLVLRELTGVGWNSKENETRTNRRIAGSWCQAASSAREEALPDLRGAYSAAKSNYLLGGL